MHARENRWLSFQMVFLALAMLAALLLAGAAGYELRGENQPLSSGAPTPSVHPSPRLP